MNAVLDFGFVPVGESKSLFINVLDLCLGKEPEDNFSGDIVFDPVVNKKIYVSAGYGGLQPILDDASGRIIGLTARNTEGRFLESFNLDTKEWEKLEGLNINEGVYWGYWSEKVPPSLLVFDKENKNILYISGSDYFVKYDVNNKITKSLIRRLVRDIDFQPFSNDMYIVYDKSLGKVFEEKVEKVSDLARFAYSHELTSLRELIFEGNGIRVELPPLRCIIGNKTDLSSFNCISIDPSEPNHLYVGGSFTIICPENVHFEKENVMNNISLYDLSDNSWNQFGSSYVEQGVNGSIIYDSGCVNGIVFDPNNNNLMYVCGSFSRGGGMDGVYNIAIYNKMTKKWSRLPAGGTNGSINGLKFHPFLNHLLFVYGSFTEVGEGENKINSFNKAIYDTQEKYWIAFESHDKNVFPTGLAFDPFNNNNILFSHSYTSRPYKPNYLPISQYNMTSLENYKVTEADMEGSLLVESIETPIDITVDKDNFNVDLKAGNYVKVTYSPFFPGDLEGKFVTLKSSLSSDCNIFLKGNSFVKKYSIKDTILDFDGSNNLMSSYVVDFNKVKKGDVKSKKFYIKNEGNINLEITKIETNAPFYVEDKNIIILPDEVVDFEVSFNSNLKGKFNGILSFSSNFGNIEVYVFAQCFEELISVNDGETLDFGYVEIGESLTKKVKVNDIVNKLKGLHEFDQRFVHRNSFLGVSSLHPNMLEVLSPKLLKNENKLYISGRNDIGFVITYDLDLNVMEDLIKSLGRDKFVRKIKKNPHANEIYLLLGNTGFRTSLTKITNIGCIIYNIEDKNFKYINGLIGEEFIDGEFIDVFFDKSNSDLLYFLINPSTKTLVANRVIKYNKEIKSVETLYMPKSYEIINAIAFDEINNIIYTSSGKKINTSNGEVDDLGEIFENTLYFLFSNDFKYLYFSNMTKRYNVENSSLEDFSSKLKCCSSAIFDPFDDNKIYLNFVDKIGIYEISSDELNLIDINEIAIDLILEKGIGSTWVWWNDLWRGENAPINRPAFVRIGDFFIDYESNDLYITVVWRQHLNYSSDIFVYKILQDELKIICQDEYFNVTNITSSSLCISFDKVSFPLSLTESNEIEITYLPSYGSNINDENIYIEIDGVSATHQVKLYGTSEIKEWETPNIIDFGIIKIGNENIENILISNNGNICLEIYEIIFSSNFFSVYDENISVPSNESFNLFVKFNPLELMFYEEEMIVKSNFGEKKITLIGRGQNKCVEINKSLIDFGFVDVSGEKSLEFKIKNNCTENKVVENIIGTEGLIFNEIGFLLQEGEEKFISVTFNPLNPVDISEYNIEIFLHEESDPICIKLLGTSEIKEYEIFEELDFGEKALDIKHFKKIAIKNNGNIDLVISGISDRITAPFFIESNNVIIQEGETKNLEVYFEPLIKNRYLKEVLKDRYEEFKKYYNYLQPEINDYEEELMIFSNFGNKKVKLKGSGINSRVIVSPSFIYQHEIPFVKEINVKDNYYREFHNHPETNNDIPVRGMPPLTIPIIVQETKRVEVPNSCIAVSENFSKIAVGGYPKHAMAWALSQHFAPFNHKPNYYQNYHLGKVGVYTYDFENKKWDSTIDLKRDVNVLGRTSDSDLVINAIEFDPLDDETIYVAGNFNRIGNENISSGFVKINIKTKEFKTFDNPFPLGYMYASSPLAKSGYQKVYDLKFDPYNPTNLYVGGNRVFNTETEEFSYVKDEFGFTIGAAMFFDSENIFFGGAYVTEGYKFSIFNRDSETWGHYELGGHVQFPTKIISLVPIYGENINGNYIDIYIKGSRPRTHLEVISTNPTIYSSSTVLKARIDHNGECHLVGYIENGHDQISKLKKHPLENKVYVSKGDSIEEIDVNFETPIGDINIIPTINNNWKIWNRDYYNMEVRTTSSGQVIHYWQDSPGIINDFKILENKIFIAGDFKYSSALFDMNTEKFSTFIQREGVEVFNMISVDGVSFDKTHFIIDSLDGINVQATFVEENLEGEYINVISNDPASPHKIKIL